MVVRTEIKVTAEQYRTLPGNGPQHQLIDGDLFRMSPAPSLRHQRLVGRLHARLFAHVEREETGLVVVSPVDVYLDAHNVLQPDLVFLSSRRSDRAREDGFHGAPDLVVEVLSPSTRTLDLGVKRSLYARHGVVAYWAIDPDLETLSVYHFSHDPDAPSEILGRSEVLVSEVVRGFSMPLDELFRGL